MLVTPYPPGIPLLIPGSASIARSFVTCSSCVNSTSVSRLRDGCSLARVSEREGSRGDYSVDCVKQD